MGNTQVSPSAREEPVSDDALVRPSLRHYARSASLTQRRDPIKGSSAHLEKSEAFIGKSVKPEKQKRLWLVMEAWVQTFLVKVHLAMCTTAMHLPPNP